MFSGAPQLPSTVKRLANAFPAFTVIPVPDRCCIAVWIHRYLRSARVADLVVVDPRDGTPAACRRVARCRDGALVVCHTDPHRHRIAACIHRDARLEGVPREIGVGGHGCLPTARRHVGGGPNFALPALTIMLPHRDRAAARVHCDARVSREAVVCRDALGRSPPIFRRKRSGPHFRVRSTIVEPNGHGCAARVDGEIGIVPIGDTLGVSPSVIDRLAFGIVSTPNDPQSTYGEQEHRKANQIPHHNLPGSVSQSFKSLQQPCQLVRRNCCAFRVSPAHLLRLGPGGAAGARNLPLCELGAYRRTSNAPTSHPPQLVVGSRAGRSLPSLLGHHSTALPVVTASETARTTLGTRRGPPAGEVGLVVGKTQTPLTRLEASNRRGRRFLCPSGYAPARSRCCGVLKIENPTFFEIHTSLGGWFSFGCGTLVAPSQKEGHVALSLSARLRWLRGPDLNRRPSGYEDARAVLLMLCKAFLSRFVRVVSC